MPGNTERALQRHHPRYLTPPSPNRQPRPPRYISEQHPADYPCGIDGISLAEYYEDDSRRDKDSDEERYCPQYIRYERRAARLPFDNEYLSESFFCEVFDEHERWTICEDESFRVKEHVDSPNGTLVPWERLEEISNMAKCKSQETKKQISEKLRRIERVCGKFQAMHHNSCIPSGSRESDNRYSHRSEYPRERSTCFHSPKDERRHLRRRCSMDYIDRGRSASSKQSMSGSLSYI